MEDTDRAYLKSYFERREREAKQRKEKMKVKTTPEEAMEYAKQNAPIKCPDVLDYPNPLPDTFIPIDHNHPSPLVLRDTIVGIMMGQATGDCIGVHGEGRMKDEVEYLYTGKQLTLKTCAVTFGTIRFMNEKFELDDWTDDTDQCLLILDSLVRNNGNVDVVDFARRMKYWRYFGFPEMGDLMGLGYGSTFKNATSHPQFVVDPIASSRELMERGVIVRSTDGSVMRTSVAAIPYFWDEEKVIENARLFGIVTHPSMACQTSVTVVVLLLSKLLMGREDIDNIIQETYQRALVDIKDDERLIKMLRNHVEFEELSELVLEEEMSHTMKPMACAIHSLRMGSKMKAEGIEKKEIFRRCMTEIIMEGGDADTNCAVAGAVLGGYLKGDCIPDEWLLMKHIEWYKERINRLLHLYQLDSI